MSKRITAVLFAALLLMSSLTVQAAPATLPISKSNSYSMQVGGGGLTNIPYLSLQIMK